MKSNPKNEQTKDNLKRRIEFLEQVIDNIPSPIWVKKLDSTHVLVNKTYCDMARMYDMVGKTKEEIIGKDDYELFPNEVKIIRKADMDAVRKNIDISQSQIDYVGYDGRKITSHIMKKLLKGADGKVTHFVGIWFDITERKLMERLFNIKEKIRKSSGFSEGLENILKESLIEFNRDIGAFLTIDRANNVALVQAYHSEKEGFEINDSYPLDGGYAELDVLEKGVGYSKIVGQQEPKILGTPSISCVPIYLGRKLCGILTLGDIKGRILSNESLAVLELYSDLATTIFETQSLLVKPIRETVTKRKRKFDLVPGYSYLIKDEIERAFDIFIDQVLSGSEGLCISREFPPRVRDRHRLEKTPIVWLTEQKVENETTIYSLQDLSLLLSQFLNTAKQSVVLLESLEYLITNHGFRPFIQFLQLSRSKFEQNNGVFIAPIDEGALDAKELKLIEKEMKVF